MGVTYPRDIVDGDTGRHGRIHRGHGLDPKVVKADLLADQPDRAGDEIEIVEVWFHYWSRIKWCDRYDGFGCGLEGEWHGHWSAVMPGNPDTAYTEAFFARDRF